MGKRKLYLSLNVSCGSERSFHFNFSHILRPYKDGDRCETALVLFVMSEKVFSAALRAQTPEVVTLILYQLLYSVVAVVCLCV